VRPEHAYEFLEWLKLLPAWPNSAHGRSSEQGLYRFAPCPTPSTQENRTNREGRVSDSLCLVRPVPQYREAVPCAGTNRGPHTAAISTRDGACVYGISDTHPASIHLTVPMPHGVRRQKPKGVVLGRPKTLQRNPALPFRESSPNRKSCRNGSVGKVPLVRQLRFSSRREGDRQRANRQKSALPESAAIRAVLGDQLRCDS
jgi:hypothetical protein